MFSWVTALSLRVMVVSLEGSVPLRDPRSDSDGADVTTLDLLAACSP